MHIYNKVCPVLFGSPQMHQWTCTYMSAFVPSTLQLMHGYMSIVNTMPCQQPQWVHTCQHWIQRKSSCVHRQQPVCLSTFITKVCVLRACPPKPNVRTCLYCLRPLHVCICQSSTQALCGVDNNLNICHLYIHVCIGFNSSQYLMCTSTSLCAWAWCTYIPALPSPLACVCTSIVNQALCGIDNNLNINCHIIHHLYWHLHTCQHHLPSKWTSCVYKSMHIHTTKSLSNKASMVK